MKTVNATPATLKLSDVAKSLKNELDRFNEACDKSHSTDTGDAQDILNSIEKRLMPFVMKPVKGAEDYNIVLNITSIISCFNSDSEAAEHFDTDSFWEKMISNGKNSVRYMLSKLSESKASI